MTAEAPSLNAQRTAVDRAIHQLLDHPRVFDDPLAVADIANGLPSLMPSRVTLDPTGRRISVWPVCKGKPHSP